MTSIPEPTLMEKYVLDTSFFLDLWKVDGPFSKEIFVGIWDALQEAISSGAVVAPSSVREELRREKADHDLKSWVSDHAGIFIPFDEAQLAVVTEIVRKFPGYALGVKNLADPQIVALGYIRGLTVLTSEKWVSTLANDNPKMPNVCESFGVTSLNVRSYCASEGIELHRAPQVSSQ